MRLSILAGINHWKLIMEYNLAVIADNLIEKFDKKLESNQKAVQKDINLIFSFLGDELQFEERKQLEQVIADILSDGNKNHSALFTQTMHKMMRAIKEVVK